MEMNLEYIIDKIKKDGVLLAEKKAEEIVKDTEKKREEIIKKAELEKKEIIKKAEEEARKLKNNAEASIKQAMRDAILSARESLTSLFDNILKKEIETTLNPQLLKELVMRLAENIKSKEAKAIEIILSEEDKKALEKLLLEKAKSKLEEGIILKTSPNVTSGLRIGIKGENVYYDFTSSAILEAIKAFLNPKILEILNSA